MQFCLNANKSDVRNSLKVILVDGITDKLSKQNFLTRIMNESKHSTACEPPLSSTMHDE